MPPCALLRAYFIFIRFFACFDAACHMMPLRHAADASAMLVVYVCYAIERAEAQERMLLYAPRHAA